MNPPTPRTIDDLLSLPEWDSFRESKLGNDLFLSDPDRADRIHAAAEYGADGSTHAETIEDWREFAEQVLRDAECHVWSMDDDDEAEAFEKQVAEAFEELSADIDACEAWHDANGSLYEEIG